MTTKLIISNPRWLKNKPIDYDDIYVKDSKGLSKDDLYAIAKEQLRESQRSRSDCLGQMRLWIQQNEDIDGCFTDDNFLLRFLRVKKFSVPMAQQLLLKYLNYRKRFSYIFYNMDYCDSMVNELITNGYVYVSPVRDSKSRRVIIYDMSKFDPRRYTGTDMSRVHAITYETLLADEQNQILGVTHIADIRSVNPAFVTLFSVTEFGYLIKWGEQSFPMRHKEIHMLNMPQALRYIYEFAKSNMSRKLKERFMVHDSNSSLLSVVDKRCLPREFGGDIPSKTMIQMWKQELETQKPKLLSLDTINLLSDRGIIRSKTSGKDETGIGSLPGSFRKLEVD